MKGPRDKGSEGSWAERGPQEKCPERPGVKKIKGEESEGECSRIKREGGKTDGKRKTGNASEFAGPPSTEKSHGGVFVLCGGRRNQCLLVPFFFFWRSG